MSASKGLKLQSISGVSVQLSTQLTSAPYLTYKFWALSTAEPLCLTSEETYNAEDISKAILNGEVIDLVSDWDEPLPHTGIDVQFTEDEGQDAHGHRHSRSRGYQRLIARKPFRVSCKRSGPMPEIQACVP